MYSRYAFPRTTARMTTQLPLIFLDLDGVLNSQLWYVRTKGSRERDDLDREAIGYLNDLVSTTGARVVVSSTWRLNRTIEQLQEILVRNGFTGEVIGKTPDMRVGENSDSILRGNEILAWIKGNPTKCGVPYWDYKRYVIFDDDSDMLYWQKDNFIKTDAYCGLTPNNCWHAKKILTGWDFDSIKG